MSEKRCENCRFWADVDADNSGLGSCHRYPPQMAKVQRRYANEAESYHDTERPQDGGWPLTFPEDWCGEWQARPEEQKEAPPGATTQPS